jgi:hypothetical protein
VIPAILPVVLYITRIHGAFQGISGSYGKIVGFWESDLGVFLELFRLKAQLIAAQGQPATRTWVVMPDGAFQH